MSQVRYRVPRPGVSEPVATLQTHDDHAAAIRWAKLLDRVADRLVADAHGTLELRKGRERALLFDWAVATLPTFSEAGAGWRRWLLARRSLTHNAKGDLEIALLPVRCPDRHP
ncbi:hypothetical protein ACFWPK_09440 [Nocardia sp. NPDC058519]|uniref:hypothetical protein n=1 Tax=Nocardia sp. NPDC058519 TaxID=3346535 RepID=UPI0036689E4F